MQEEGREERVARLVVYAGPALYGESDPLEVCVDFDVLGALWASESCAWTGLLQFIEDDIRRNGH